MGVATAGDLADYHRQKTPVVRPLLGELVEDGALLAATVRGWKQSVFVHPEARTPRKVAARALLSPFDSLIWNRDRTERLFDFRYRIEIYVPAAKREHGYYVLPFLLGDRLVARVDLKADRKTKVLVVNAAYGEPGSSDVAGELLSELRLIADWLELDRIKVAPKGDLAGDLAAELA